MAKRDRKKKGQGQKPSQQGAGESSGGGLMMSMRGGFKNIAGGESKGPKTPLQKAGDIAFWVLIAALLAFMFYRRFR